MIDTHCHLDFLSDPHEALLDAQAAGIHRVVVPSVEVSNFSRVRALATANPQVYYCLGLHPCVVLGSAEDDLRHLKEELAVSLADPKFLGVGEIGLDHYLPGLDRMAMEQVFHAQLRLARDFDLPVVLHVRRAQDLVLKGLRRFGIQHGIAHAFNGSHSQAQAFLKQGFHLGFGGTLTYSGSRQIRRLAVDLPLESIVLETDSPDIAPSWLSRGESNTPKQIRGIAGVLAELRGVPISEIEAVTSRAAAAALSRLPAEAL